MAFLRHENIKVLENALRWLKNGILSFIAIGLNIWLGQIVPLTAREPRLAPVRC
jgi:hypothetical protein